MCYRVDTVYYIVYALMCVLSDCSAVDGTYMGVVKKRLSGVRSGRRGGYNFIKSK